MSISRHSVKESARKGRVATLKEDPITKLEVARHSLPPSYLFKLGNDILHIDYELLQCFYRVGG
jgi:hypothetical protein